ncbi:hypothetical protein THAOC_26816, partial [Thalassiosira oceanica]
RLRGRDAAVSFPPCAAAPGLGRTPDRGAERWGDRVPEVDVPQLRPAVEEGRPEPLEVRHLEPRPGPLPQLDPLPPPGAPRRLGRDCLLGATARSFPRRVVAAPALVRGGEEDFRQPPPPALADHPQHALSAGRDPEGVLVVEVAVVQPRAVAGSAPATSASRALPSCSSGARGAAPMPLLPVGRHLPSYPPSPPAALIVAFAKLRRPPAAEGEPRRAQNVGGYASLRRLTPPPLSAPPHNICALHFICKAFVEASAPSLARPSPARAMFAPSISRTPARDAQTTPRPAKTTARPARVKAATCMVSLSSDSHLSEYSDSDVQR